jgi:hypothetical protein
MPVPLVVFAIGLIGLEGLLILLLAFVLPGFHYDSLSSLSLPGIAVGLVLLVVYRVWPNLN